MMENGAVLVTGGAGYIGSHAVLAFSEAGYPVVVLDNLSTGVRENLPAAVPFVRGDVADMDLVETTLRQHGIRHILHFAGSIVVPESVADPLSYYRNNTSAARNLLEVAVRAKVSNFIFSSTAAVYGEPKAIPVREDAPL